MNNDKLKVVLSAMEAVDLRILPTGVGVGLSMAKKIVKEELAAPAPKKKVAKKKAAKKVAKKK